MGASSSVDTNLNLEATDVDTPRGCTAKNEVKRLRQLMFDRQKETMKLMAAARFDELDSDKSGYLENEELGHVVDWIVNAFGTRLGTDLVGIRNKMMARLDVNKDGKLDLQEFEDLFQEMLNRTLLIERAREKFKEFDTNKSGTIESDEIKAVISWTLQAYPAENKQIYEERVMANVDINKDGQLDILEFTDLFEKMIIRMELVQKAKSKFEELDADHSGFLEKTELDHLVSWVLETHIEKTEEQKQNFRDSLLVRIDINKDGKLDITEFTDLFAEMLDRMELVEEAKMQFRLLDADGSGFLEKDELAPLVHKWARANSASLKMSTETVIEDILKNMDIDKNGKIDIREFIEGFDNILYEKKTAESMKEKLHLLQTMAEEKKEAEGKKA